MLKTVKELIKQRALLVDNLRRLMGEYPEFPNPEKDELEYIEFIPRSTDIDAEVELYLADIGDG